MNTVESMAMTTENFCFLLKICKHCQPCHSWCSRRPSRGRKSKHCRCTRM